MATAAEADVINDSTTNDLNNSLVNGERKNLLAKMQVSKIYSIYITVQHQYNVLQ